MKLISGQVLECNELAADLVELVVKVPHEILDGLIPGQCAHIAVPNDRSRLLRRPISVYSVGDGKVRLAIQPKSQGTQCITAAKPGDLLNMIFPFGNGFRPGGAEEIWLVGGGVGIAPMRCCAEGFPTAKRAYFGYRTAAHIYSVDECRAVGLQVTVCTDDGSAGERGLVTAPLMRDLTTHKPDAIMACGPIPMLRAVAVIAKEHGVKLQVSMEQRMGCGIGACLTCSCTASWGGYLRVCADGPVFDSEVVKL